MMIRGFRFNTYLLAILLALGGSTFPCLAKTRKPESTLRVHLEINPDGTERCKLAPILRANPVYVTIDRSPFLNEAQVKEAKVIDVIGGFAIQIQFDRRGKWILEQYSVSNKGRRFAIFSQFVLPPPPASDSSKSKEKPDTKTNSNSGESSKKEKSSSKDVVGEGRWLAAPLIAEMITDGLLVFTPDATRAEAESIVQGLNNVAKKEQSKWLQ